MSSAKGLVSPRQNQNINYKKEIASFAADKAAINQLHQQFSEYGKNAREWLRKCALLLPEIAAKQVWRRKGFSSIYEYAAKLAGMSRSSVDDALWILEKIADKPALKQVAEERGINCVRPVATIATPETAQFWADKVQAMSKHTLATYVHDYRLESRPGPESKPVKVNISLKLNPDLAKRLEKLKTAGDIEALMERFLDQMENEAEEQAHGLPNQSVSLPADNKKFIAKVKVATNKKLTSTPATKPQPVFTSSRYIPAAIRHYVINKYHGCCAYQTCKHPYKILHHTQRFALEQVHDPDRLMPLCKQHERIIHQGLIKNEEKQPEQWRLLEEAEQGGAKYEVDKLVMSRRLAAQR